MGFHMRTSRTSGIYPSYDANFSEAQERQKNSFNKQKQKTCKGDQFYCKLSICNIIILNLLVSM